MKRIISSVLVLCLLAAAFPLNATAAPEITESTSAETDSSIPPQTPETDETVLPVTEDSPAPPETEDPPSEEDILFSAIYGAIQSEEAEYLCLSPTEPDSKIIANICSRLLNEVPEFYYLDAISVETAPLSAPDEKGNLYRCRFIPEYTLIGDKLKEARQFVERQVDLILSEMPARVSPTEQLLYLHDYICTNFSYDTDTGSAARDLYRFLQQGKGNCQGYTKLYAHLLNELGIENRFVTSTEMNHMWNLVKLDGEWYHVDLTWDDPIEDQAGRALHKNFLRSDSGIAQTAHHSYSAPYPCTSARFDTGPLPDLTGVVVFLNRVPYGVSSTGRTIVRLDLQELTSTPVADISNLRWNVWDSPDSLWKEQYLNLYSDGYLLYFNGPSSVWSFDPTIGEIQLLHEFDSTDGYLYSLRGKGHQLTCTVSKAPGNASVNVHFTTPHIYESEGGGFFTTEYCLICGHAEAFVTPEDTFLTACISARTASEATHDLRLTLLSDTAMLEASKPLSVKFSLLSPEEERSVVCPLSAEDHSSFLVYERVAANGLNYSVAEGYSIYGLIINGIENDSYDRVEVTVACEGTVIYHAVLTADEIFDPADPPETDHMTDSENASDNSSTVNTITPEMETQSA